MVGVMIDAPKLLPANLMARRLRVTLAWLRAEADAGCIPALKAGDRYLFDPEAVERVLLRRAQANAQEANHAH
jgi:adenylosuccinate lyase